MKTADHIKKQIQNLTVRYSALFLIFILGFSFVSYGISANQAFAAKSSDQAVKLIKKANDLFDRENYKAAIALYDKALKVEPSNTEALINKGIALSNLGKYNEAIKSLDRALKIDPNNIDALNEKGINFLFLGKYNDAVKQFSKILKIQPNHHDALLNIGVVFNDLGRYDDALFYFDKVLEIYPDSLLGLYNAGNTLYSAGNYEDASYYFDKALEVDPEDAMSLQSKGNTLFMLGQYGDSIAYYDAVLRLDPYNDDAKYMINAAYDELNRQPGEYGGEIEVETGQSDYAFETLRPVLQALVDEIEKKLYLPEDLTVTAGKCGQTNALYDPALKQIVICYEFLQYLDDSTNHLNEEDKGKMITSVFVFVFYHELGHALIDMYELPTTGREEDTADQIATLILQSIDLGDATMTNDELVVYTSAWFGAIGKQKASIAELEFWDEHSLDTQRFYNLVCWTYGSNPDAYGEFIRDKVLPANRADKCVVEYNKMARSINILLEPYLK